MEDKVLLFHVGMPKTGTTALQHFLQENAERLKKYGWCYPDLTGELQNKYEVKHGKNFLDAGFELDETSEKWLVTWELVKKYLQEYNVIVSEERFFKIDMPYFFKAAKKMYRNIKVIIYLRRQDTFMESRWNQYVKGLSAGTKRFNEFMEVVEEENVHAIEYRMLNMKYRPKEYSQNLHFKNYKEVLYYNKILEELAEIIGKENLIVRIYEKSQFFGIKKDVASDFLCAINMETKRNEFKNIRLENERIYGNYLEINRVMNDVLEDGESIGDALKVRDISKKLLQKFKPLIKEEGYFSKEERIAFLEQFKEQNEKVAREYLGREDGILFYDTNMAIPQYVPTTTPLEEDMIKTFTMMYLDTCKKQEELINQLKKKNHLLAESLWRLKYPNREFVCFGAGNKGREYLANTTLSISKVIDNDEAKAGARLGAAEVILAKDISDWKNYFVIVTNAVAGEIEQQLVEIGLVKNKDFVLARDYI